MEQHLESKIAEIDNSFAVVVKTQEDIINEINFKTEEDKRLCIDIIDSLGLSIANTIRQQKVAQIPLIGCVRINPVRKKFNESRKTFSAIRSNTTKEGYRQYIKDFVGAGRFLVPHIKFYMTNNFIFVVIFFMYGLNINFESPFQVSY